MAPITNMAPKCIGGVRKGNAQLLSDQWGFGWCNDVSRRAKDCSSVATLYVIVARPAWPGSEEGAMPELETVLGKRELFFVSKVRWGGDVRMASHRFSSVSSQGLIWAKYFGARTQFWRNSKTLALSMCRVLSRQHCTPTTVPRLRGPFRSEFHRGGGAGRKTPASLSHYSN